MAIKPEGDPCVYVCEKRGLDLAIIREMVDAHKEVCDWMKYEKGAVKVTTPEEIVVRHLGDPDKAENREEHNKVIVTYLSASIDAATWMGYFEPYSRRATWRK